MLLFSKYFSCLIYSNAFFAFPRDLLNRTHTQIIKISELSLNWCSHFCFFSLSAYALFVFNFKAQSIFCFTYLPSVWNRYRKVTSFCIVYLKFSKCIHIKCAFINWEKTKQRQKSFFFKNKKLNLIIEKI